MSDKYIFYKIKPTDSIYLVEEKNTDSIGAYLFSFDKNNIFNFWTDYPQKLTPEQLKIFKKELPTMAELKD